MSNTRDGCLGCGCLGIVAFVIIGLIGSCSGQSSNNSSVATQSASSPSADASPVDTPAPTEEPIAEQKKDFLDSVDESISGAMIEGNPYKYVGSNVDLHCSVASVIDETTLNAACGTDDNGIDAIIVVKYDSASQLDKGQAIRVIGTVVDPIEGENNFGGTRSFPTVEAHFME